MAVRVRRGPRCRKYLILVLIVAVTLSSKTRWSTNRIIPDADLLNTGTIIIETNVSLVNPKNVGLTYKPYIPVRFGITEWVIIDVAYAGGISAAIKCKLLNENKSFLPSIAAGASSLFNHRQAYLFAVPQSDSMATEVFLSCSKGVDQIKTRFHWGVLSIPTMKSEQINPFFGIEKYFGRGFYSSFEFIKRMNEFYYNLFFTLRFFSNRLELSTGIIDIKSSLFDDQGAFSLSILPRQSTAFFKPGFWIGCAFQTNFKFGNNSGLMGMEDKLHKQEELTTVLSKTVDSLTIKMKKMTSNLTSVQCSLSLILDSLRKDPTKMKNIIFTKLMAIKNAYAAEPYDPVRTRILIKEVASYHEKAIPCLEDFLQDSKADRYLRIYSASILGEINNKHSSTPLLDVLVKTSDPQLKIEILIALGKMKETRAMYLIEQLANHPEDDIALTAQEVLLQLSKQTGAQLSSDITMRKIQNAQEKDFSTRHLTTVTQPADSAKKTPLPQSKSATSHNEQSVDTQKTVKSQPIEQQKKEIFIDTLPKVSEQKTKSTIPQKTSPAKTTQPEVTQESIDSLTEQLPLDFNQTNYATDPVEVNPAKKSAPKQQPDSMSSSNKPTTAENTKDSVSPVKTLDTTNSATLQAQQTPQSTQMQPQQIQTDTASTKNKQKKKPSNNKKNPANKTEKNETEW